MRIRWRTSVLFSFFSGVLLTPSVIIPTPLFNNFGHNAGSHRMSAFAYGKTHSLLHRYRRYQLNRYIRVVAGHYHLHAFLEYYVAGNIRRPKIKLRAVSLEKW